MFNDHRQVTTGRGDQPFSLIVDTGSSNTWVGVNGGYPLKDVPDDDRQGNVVSKVSQACGAYLTTSTHDVGSTLRLRLIRRYISVWLAASRIAHDEACRNAGH